MKLAISNIAWLNSEDERAYEVLNYYGIKFLEIAPGRFFLNPEMANVQEIRQKKENLNSKNLEVIAMQALLFGKTEFNIFSGLDKRLEMLAYLKKIIDFGFNIGAKVLVFGSPKNRLVGNLPRKEAYSIAEEFFTEIGNYAASYGMKFCVEANSTEYGCDFITSTDEAFSFFSGLSNPGIGFHLDTGAMAMNKESPQKIIESYFQDIHHIHISEPFLVQAGTGSTDHKLISKLLKEYKYPNHISIEMKNGLKPDNIETVREAVEFCLDMYIK
jgi:D-psicose/D-tagatose/L-ribulose 3-epimerase